MITRPILLFVACSVPSVLAYSEPAAISQAVYAPLQLEAGTWDAAVQYFEDDKPSRTAVGVEVDALFVNGHWIVNDFNIPAAGTYAAYQDHGMWGYDPVAKTYVRTWVDTIDQSVRTDFGAWNESDATMVWSSKQNDGNGHYTDYRRVEEFKGQERVVTVYQLGSVKPNPRPVLKIVFTKKAADALHDADVPPHRIYKRPGT